MAKKSNNTQGNPWHSEDNGQFVSKEETASSPEEKEAMRYLHMDYDENPNDDGNEETPKTNNIKNKTDLKSKIKNWQKIKKERITGETLELEKAETVEQGMMIANRIFGRNVVYYDENTDIEAVNQMNQALFDLNKVFPKVLDGLITFGNTNSGMDSLQKRRETFARAEEYAKTINADTEFIKKFLSSYSGKSSFGVYGATRPGERGSTGGSYARETYYINGYSEENFGKKYLVGNIRLNTANTKNVKNTEEKWSASTDSGFHYKREKGIIYGITIHELGHAVHRNIQNFMTPEEDAALEGMINSFDSSKFSGYGRTRNSEMIAEAFDDVFSNTTPNFDGNRQVVDYLINMYNKYLKD